MKKHPQRSIANRKHYLHRLRAAEALGKPLPPGAVVHHADNTLVICPSHAYHSLLHTRMRVQAAGGNPNTDQWCRNCGPLPLAQFYRIGKTRHADGVCKRCHNRDAQR